MKQIIGTITVTFMAVLLIGCASSAPEPTTGRPKWTRPVMAPDGSQAHIVVCANRISRCYNRAEWVCPTGYSLLDRAGRVDVGAATARSYRVPLPRRMNVRVTRVQQRRRTVHEMLIKCNGGSYMGEGEETPDFNRPMNDEECRQSIWCKQLGRCLSRNGKCVRE